MKREDPSYTLDRLLSDWHTWAMGYRHTADIGSSPMFRYAKSRRDDESEGDIADDTIRHTTMEAINFHVFELPRPDWITALQMQARNLATGRYVWTSPRLPTDIKERALLLRDARNALMEKLVSAGVI